MAFPTPPPEPGDQLCQMDPACWLVDWLLHWPQLVLTLDQVLAGVCLPQFLAVTCHSAAGHSPKLLCLLGPSVWLG